MSDAEEKQLVLDLKKGKKEAIQEFYNAYHGFVFYYASKLCNDERDGEELTQDVFLKALRKIHQLKKSESLKSWLIAISINSYKNFMVYQKKDKRSAKFAKEDISGFENLDAGEEFLPDYVLEKEELKKKLVDMVGELPYQQKTVILGFYFYDLSLKEISKNEGCSINAVKNALFKGRVTLKRKVEELAGSEKNYKAVLAATPILTQVLKEDYANTVFSPEAVDRVWNNISEMVPAISTILGIKSLLLSAKVLISLSAVVAIPVIGLAVSDMNHLDPVMIESIATKELKESETMPIAVIEQPVEIIEERVVAVEEPAPEPTVYFEDWGLLEQMRNSSDINNHYLLEQLLYKYGFIEETFGGSEVYGDLHLYSFTEGGQKIVIAERINSNTNEWGLNYGVYGENDVIDKGLMHSMLGIPYF